jgi:Lar family restriction alleviation protein
MFPGDLISAPKGPDAASKKSGPCPWCASTTNDVHQRRSKKLKAFVYQVNCHACGTRGPVAFSREDAVTQWNMRKHA